MDISKSLLITTVLSSVFIQSSAWSIQPKVNLGTSKKLVVKSDKRTEALEVGYLLLAEKGGEFTAHAAELRNPFSFSKPEEPEEEVAQEEEIRRVVNYDDASVLNVVASNFSRQVRGSLARGAKNFLMLDGGTLLKPGTSFPVKIPEAEGQSFTLTISEITSDGYTLQLGDASKLMTYDNSQGIR